MIDTSTPPAITPFPAAINAMRPADPANLRGQVVLITGDCRGASAAIAQVLGECGMRVVLADGDLQRAQDRAAVLGERDIPAMALALDLNDPTQCAAAVETVVRRLGRLDVVVNHTITDLSAPEADPGVDAWQRGLGTDLSGPMVMSRYAGQQMLRQGGGHVINIAATASRRAWPHASAYHAAAWSLQSLSQALRAELQASVHVSDFVAGDVSASDFSVQDPLHVARAVRHVLQQPDGSVHHASTPHPSTLESARP